MNIKRNSFRSNTTASNKLPFAGDFDRALGTAHSL